MKLIWKKCISATILFLFAFISVASLSTGYAVEDPQAAVIDPSNLESYIEIDGEKDAAESSKKPEVYSLNIDVINQVVSAYNSSGHLVRQMICSTGKDETPTPLGSSRSSSQYRWGYFTKFDVWAQYWTRINGPILFHSVLYQKEDESTLISSSVSNLGRRASHGCVRLRVQDAKWIYDNCPRGTQTVTFEGPRDSRYNAAIKSAGSLEGKNLYISSTTNPSGSTARVKTKGGSLNMRASENTASTAITQLPNGAKVTVLASTAEGWMQIFYRGIFGYVSPDYLAIDGETEISEERLSAGKIATSGVSLNLRSEANSSSAVLNVIPNGTEISIVSEEAGWYLIVYEGQQGYVSSKYVDSAAKSFDSGKVSTGGGALNMREKPDSASKSLASIPNGTVLMIEAYQGEWAVVSYSGKQGYVFMPYIEGTTKYPQA